MPAKLLLHCNFHLNLCYSSVDVHRHRELIDRCYWPLLEIVGAHGIPLGIELSGHTLEILQDLDPRWVSEFKNCLAAGACELIGSGDSQLIGPLVPAEINAFNIRAGLQAYQDFLAMRPALALLNEQAYASGLLEHYIAAGYKAILTDCDSVLSAIEDCERDWRYYPQYAQDQHGACLAVIWTSSVVWRKTQQYVYRELSKGELLAFLLRQRGDEPRALCLYANDAEVFGFRPAQSKVPLADAEWQRWVDMLLLIKAHPDIEFIKPSAVLNLLTHRRAGRGLSLQSVVHPLPVKKTLKYNISRWAVSGRDDLWLNSFCHRVYARLTKQEFNSQWWRQLCRFWASDYRTHITTRRWQDLQLQLAAFSQRFNIPLDPVSSLSAAEPLRAIRSSAAAGVKLDYSEEAKYLCIETGKVRVKLNLRKGLAIESLAFSEHDFRPVIGSVPLGFFHEFELAADFYTGLVLLETTDGPKRMTDLEPVTAKIYQSGDWLVVGCKIDMHIGWLEKQLWISLGDAKIRYRVSFPGWPGIRGKLRVGYMTLLPQAFGSIRLRCKNGGHHLETFILDRQVRHDSPVSHLVSCQGGFAATDGRLLLGDKCRSVLLTWQPQLCAAMPMLHHRLVQGGSLTRLIFSLVEFDDTSRGSRALPFMVSMGPGPALAL